jgi:hypothetical protein
VPQNNLYFSAKKFGSNAFGPNQLDGVGGLLVAVGGLYSALDITASTVIKTGAGRVAKVSVLVAGSAAGTVNDCATTGAAAVANQIYTIPNTVGTYTLDWPTTLGIVVVPGTGQTLAVSYS